MSRRPGQSLSSKWVSSLNLDEGEIWLTHADKEGEDRFCRYVDHMPPVSCLKMIVERSKLMRRNQREWSDCLIEGYVYLAPPCLPSSPSLPTSASVLFQSIVRYTSMLALMTGLLLCPRRRCDLDSSSSLQNHQCHKIPRIRPWFPRDILLISNHPSWSTIRHDLNGPH
jgi:hypothetical protein